MTTENAIRISYFLLRVVAGFLFFQAGAIILFGWFGGMPSDPSAPPPPAWMVTQMQIGGVLEFAGGIAIMLGLLTRPVAFVLSGMMAVAYWQFHAPNGTWPAQNGGIPAVLFCFLFLYMAAHGAGKWSVDAAIRRARTAKGDER